ncbi:hypothetical protein H0H92_004478 [Tricholoma furcatifolium]|nr:hypothetical protein H0H92_004478 [Tricholoma furcatifolium]
MAESKIFTSRSILMHSSLAYCSSELRTFDSIIHDSYQGTLCTAPTSITLPTEILLEIRHHLFPTITTHLFRRSNHALVRYETSIRTLLCQDCLSYNQEVYGMDIWQWDHFTGACSCRGRNRTLGSRVEDRQALEYCDFWNQKQAFPDCSSWLELYLSLETSRLTGYTQPMRSIWDVVNMTLHDYGCRLMTHPAQYWHLPSRGIKIDLDIPTPLVIVPDNTSTLNGGSGFGPVALHRADRDLALSFAYEKGLQMWNVTRRSNTLAGSHSDDPPPLGSSIQSQAIEIISTASAAVTVAVSLPVTLATVALTIVCFYSPMSRALRIL